MEIAGRKIGSKRPPFVIAEMSGNHNGKLARALEIVRAAADAGADAIKLQTYTADTITLNSRRDEFRIKNPKSLWYGRYYYDLYQEAHTPWEWHEAIFSEAAAAGISCFSSPFDSSAVDYLENLDCPAYKVASFEIVHLPLIRRIAETGKPVILSTGLATTTEIRDAIAEIRSVGNNPIALLKCTSAYPAEAADANLSTIPVMRSLFGTEVGFSDHTLGNDAAREAVGRYGASIIEKHFTLQDTEGGVDESFSASPADLASLVDACAQASELSDRLPGLPDRVLQGKPTFGPSANEVPSLNTRPSLWFARNISAGETIAPSDVLVRRPGYGLPPKCESEIVGRSLAKDVTFGEPVSWDSFESR